MAKNYDFSGWATRHNIKCSDGRTIMQDAFASQNGKTVPLVWNHNHKDADNVLGHALLENRKEGVYAYCSFNDTPEGQRAKTLVEHKDLTSLSIYANQLKQNAGNVTHGLIREVSLVLAGANPGAVIESLNVTHSDDPEDLGDAVIWNDSETLEICHACGDSSNDEKKKKELEHAKDNEENTKEKPVMAEEKKEKTIQEVFDSMTEEQKNCCYALVGAAVEEAKNEKNDKGEKQNMKHNVFDNEVENDENVLTHDEFMAVMADAKRNGSVKDAFLQHSITDVSYLFPEVQGVNKAPLNIVRDQTWVQKVMNKVHHSAFSRIKSTAMNLTADAARAKGYIKGHQKAEEVIVALKRTTTPQTVYKLQKIDRDDIVDITDFDVIAYIKQEMRVMLDEELARAFLIGDGRQAASDDKINATNIRPILGDSNVYTVARYLEPAAGATSAEFAKAFIEDAIRARKEYKGSGSPALYTTEDMLTDMLLIQDTNGRYIYESVEKLATTLRVSEIITVPVMENVVRTDSGYDYTCLGIIVNLADYNVGADKGGAVSMFEDFDIDYNKEKYLIETRCSGALVKPYSAISFEKKTVHQG